jgi:hypothetical protein
VLASSGCPFLADAESSDVIGELGDMCPVKFGVEVKAYVGTFGVDANPLPLKLVVESRCFNRLFRLSRSVSLGSGVRTSVP